MRKSNLNNRVSQTVIVLFCLLGLLPISAQASSDPYQLMRQVGEQVFSRIEQEHEAIAQSPDHYKVIIEQEIMPHVNYKYAGLKLLGTHLKGQDKEEVNQFLEAFRGYLVASYAQVFTQYTDQEIAYAPAASIAEGTRILTIALEIVEVGKPNINIQFKWRSNKKGTQWLVFDMIAEGVSLLSSKQSEWSNDIRNKGLVYVTQELNRLAQAPIKTN